MAPRSSRASTWHLRHGGHYVVRTSGLYGRRPSSVKGYTFVSRILAQAEAGEPIRVVDDVTFSPSYAADVAAGVRRIVETGAPGTYHLTNAGETTWYGFAVAALELSGIAADVHPVDVLRLSERGPPAGLFGAGAAGVSRGRDRAAARLARRPRRLPAGARSLRQGSVPIRRPAVGPLPEEPARVAARP